MNDDNNDLGASLLPVAPSASVKTETLPHGVAAEIERSLDMIERESFIIDYSVIGRGAGGLGAVVELSTAKHAILFIRRTLRGSGTSSLSEASASDLPQQDTTP